MSNERTSKLAPLLIVFGVVLFFLSVWGISRYYVGRFSLPPEMIYGEPLPKTIKPLASFRTPEGLTADLYNSPDFTKVGFAFSFAQPAQPAALSGQDIIAVLSQSSRTKELDPRLTEFSRGYLSAQFDARRAYNLSPVDVVLGDTTVQAVQFNSKAEWNHLVGIVNLPHGQFAFQAVRKNTPVDPKTVADIVSKEIAASANWKNQQG